MIFRLLFGICITLFIASAKADEIQVTPIDPLYTLTTYDLKYDFREKNDKNPKWLSFDDAVPVKARRTSIQLVGARGGMASGSVASSSVCSAQLSGDLKGDNGNIPLSAVTIRYTSFYGSSHFSHWRKPGWRINTEIKKGKSPSEMKFWYVCRLDDLHAKPQEHPGIHSFWVTIEIPKDTKPGLYKSTLSAAGKTFPVELTVADYEVPESGEFEGHLAFMWSYDNLARQFKVKSWSKEHYDAIEQTHAWLNRLGNQTLVITMLADNSLLDKKQYNYLGDTAAMLRFRKSGDELEPDWSVVENILDAYKQDIGTPKFLVFQVWTQVLYGVKTKHAPNNMPAPDEVEVPVTLVGEDGTLSVIRIKPPYMDEHKLLWKEVFDGLYKQIEKQGWSKDILVIGSGADGRPRRQTAEAFKELATDRWVVFSHGRGLVMPDESGKPLILGASGVNIAYCEHVYAPCITLREDGILGGWNLPYKRYTSIRNYMRPSSSLVQYRSIIDASIGTGEVNEIALKQPGLQGDGYVRFAREMIKRVYSGAGLTRVPLLPGSPQGHLEMKWSFPGVYRENPQYLLNVDGNVLQPTGRMLMFAEGRYESEARIQLEKALVNKKISGAFEKEVREFLKERIRIMTSDGNYSCAGGLGSGQYGVSQLAVADDWQAVTLKLFTLAGKVQKK